MAVSTASIWQKNSGLSRSGSVQYSSRRLVRLVIADMAALPPLAYPFADSVDEVGLLEPAVGPLRAERELRPFLPGCRDRNEVPAQAPSLDDLVGDALIVEAKVAGGWPVGGVQDRIVDRDGRHGAILLHQM